MSQTQEIAHPILSVEMVTRRYKLPRTTLFGEAPVLTAVKDVSFSIGMGETLGVVGESGSGKSTLARLVMGFEQPDEGVVRFDGHDLARLTPAAFRIARRGFQMVFQDPNGSLDPRRTVGWSIAEPLRAQSVPQAEHPARVAEVLEQVGLRTDYAKRFPHEFSGGQRQRIAIARAIVIRPRLLVADEAVSALDVSVQAQILNLLMDLQDELRLAIMFISHDLAVISSICDRMIVMRHGKVLEEGPMQTVISAPRHAYTQALLSAARLED